MSNDKPISVQPFKFERPAKSTDALVTLKTATGDMLALALSPHAQAELLLMLVATAKGRRVGNDFELTRPPMRATSFASFAISNELYGLEIGIRSDAAIHVGFDMPTFLQLKAAVNDISSPRIATPPGESKH